MELRQTHGLQDLRMFPASGSICVFNLGKTNGADVTSTKAKEIAIQIISDL